MEDEILKDEDLNTILEAAWSQVRRANGEARYDKLAEEDRACVETTRKVVETRMGRRD